MCLSIFYWNPNSNNSEADEYISPYKLIFISNRDEFFERETEIAHFWNFGTPHKILAGKDLVGGGSWMACSEDAKFATLTNYRIPFEAMRMDARKRGTLIIDFVKEERSIENYLKEIIDHRNEFNPFNIVVGDLRRKKLGYYGTKQSLSQIEGQSGFEFKGVGGDQPFYFEDNHIYSLGNGDLWSNWRKQLAAATSLKNVIDQHNISEEKLINSLFDNVLSNTQRDPEDQLVQTGVPKDWELYLSSIFVTTDENKKYGTRAQTIVLVDQNNKLTFVERNLILPSLRYPQNLVRHIQNDLGNWVEVKYEMDLKI